MRKFIKLTISFLLLLVITTVALIKTTEYIVDKKANFEFMKNAKYLVVGDSHPECAFNDSLIENFMNLSQSGDSYFYTYFKAMKIIEQNPSIEFVFIEFNNNQLDESMNEWIWSEKYLNFKYPTYSPFMKTPDEKLLAMHNFSAFVNANSLALKTNFERIFSGNYYYTKDIGGYSYSERDKTDSLLNKMKGHISPEKKTRISESNLHYLSKLVNLCKEKNKQTFLIRSPVHNAYVGYSNENIYEKIRRKNFSSIETLDFSKFPLANSEFGDLEHLNHKGAKVFSIWFNNLLKKNLLFIENKQKLIDEEIKTQMLESVQKNSRVIGS